MTPAECRAARLSFKIDGKPMTQAQLAAVMETDSNNVARIERGARPAPARYARLLRAYLRGHRPKDWPK